MHLLFHEGRVEDKDSPCHSHQGNIIQNGLVQERSRERGGRHLSLVFGGSLSVAAHKHAVGGRVDAWQWHESGVQSIDRTSYSSILIN